MLTKFTFKINRQGTEVLSVDMDMLTGIQIKQKSGIEEPRLRMRGLMGYPTDCMTIQHGDTVEITTQERVGE